MWLHNHDYVQYNALMLAFPVIYNANRYYITYKKSVRLFRPYTWPQIEIVSSYLLYKYNISQCQNLQEDGYVVICDKKRDTWFFLFSGLCTGFCFIHASRHSTWNTISTLGLWRMFSLSDKWPLWCSWKRLWPVIQWGFCIRWLVQEGEIENKKSTSLMERIITLFKTKEISLAQLEIQSICKSMKV